MDISKGKPKLQAKLIACTAAKQPASALSSLTVLLPKISQGDKEVAEYFLQTGDESVCSVHFHVPKKVIELSLARPEVATFIAIRQADISEAAALTREKVLARLNAILDNRLNVSKNLLRGIEVAAKVLGMIRPDIAIAIQNNVSPYSQLTDAELEAEIRKRLELPDNSQTVIDAEVIQESGASAADQEAAEDPRR